MEIEEARAALQTEWATTLGATESALYYQFESACAQMVDENFRVQPNASELLLWCMQQQLTQMQEKIKRQAETIEALQKQMTAPEGKKGLKKKRASNVPEMMMMESLNLWTNGYWRDTRNNRRQQLLLFPEW